jgi:hypothetical protein
LHRELLSRLVRKFDPPAGTGAAPAAAKRRETIDRLLARLLGKEPASLEAGPEEFAERIAKALNTVFDSLNGIIGTINATLLGRRAEMETIRHVIGSSIEGAAGAQSIDDYLDQIQRAFLVAHQAFQEAARTKAGQLLAELDPSKVETEAEGSLKFGALRKAELFDIYKDKYGTCRRWLDSGRFTEELLREFEKSCRRLYTPGHGGRT